jgi:hypothetical protein
MRRLTAYREKYSQVPSTATFGRLTIVEKLGSATIQTTTSLVLGFRFEYNYTKYAVVISKEGGSELTASNLAAIGVSPDEVVINVEMKKYRFAIASKWIFSGLISAMVSSITGMTIVSRVSDSSATTTILQSDTSEAQKVVTGIANVNSALLNSVTASTVSNEIYTTVATKYDFFDLHIDDKTSIGITYQGFKPESPDQIGFKFSNSFSIPRTANNDKITGFGGISNDVYDPWFVNYIIDNDKIISSGKIKVTEITKDRINCTIAAKSSVWDRLKSDKWPDFIAGMWYWFIKPENNTWSGFLDEFNFSTSSFAIKAIYGDLHGDSEMELITRDEQYKSAALNEIVFKISGFDGGQICTLVKTIFDYIRVKYDIDMVTYSTVFDNISPYFQNRYVKIYRGLASPYTFATVYTRGYSNGSTEGVKSDKASKSVYDFVKEFIIHSGCVVDVIDDTTIALNRMDDLMLAPVVDFSGNIEKDSIVFTPSIDGISQNNIIDFSEYSSKIQKGSLQINIPCLNQNVETTSQFLELKEFAPPAYLDRDKNVLGLFEEGSWNNFTFLQDSGETASYDCLAYFNLTNELSTTKTLSIAKIMDVGYSLWAEMIKKPRKYRIKKWLTSSDIKNIKLFQRYWIQELQGYFMLLKVNGLNPEKSNEATEMEFIQIVDPNALSNFGVYPESLTPNTAGGSDAIEIYTGESWYVLENYSWISLSKTNGVSGETINIVTTANSTTADRTASIVVNSGGEQRAITIIQKALIVTPPTLYYESLGGVQYISIHVKGAWTITASQLWISVLTSSGNDDAVVGIRVLRTSIERDGFITITSGTVSSTIIVYQSV